MTQLTWTSCVESNKLRNWCYLAAQLVLNIPSMHTRHVRSMWQGRQLVVQGREAHFIYLGNSKAV